MSPVLVCVRVRTYTIGPQSGAGLLAPLPPLLALSETQPLLEIASWQL